MLGVQSEGRVELFKDNSLYLKAIVSVFSTHVGCFFVTSDVRDTRAYDKFEKVIEQNEQALLEVLEK